MKTVLQLEDQIRTATAEVEAIAKLAEEEGRELSDEENAQCDKLFASVESIKENELPRRQKIEAMMAQKESRIISESSQRFVEERKIHVPVHMRSRKLKAFQGEGAHEAALTAGHFYAATIYNRTESAEWLEDHGMPIKAAMGGSDANKGQALVPLPLSDQIINLQTVYGIYARNMTAFPMTAHTEDVPRRTGGLTVYHNAENTAITDSDMTLDQVRLSAEPYNTLTRVSRRLDEDSIIALGDLLTLENAQRFAEKTDQNAFLGDSSANSAGVTGFANFINAANFVTASGTGYGDVTLKDFEKVVGETPVYPGAMNAWYINSKAAWSTMFSLQNAAGGNAISDLAMGPQPTFMGFPVYYAQVLPMAGAASEKFCYFGDVNLASKYGVRRQIDQLASEHRYLEFDQIGVRTTARIAITVHEGGTSGTQGPIVGLQLASA